MSYRIYLTQDALQDLEELDEYIAVSDSAAKADYVLRRLETALQRLADSPERGSRPRELLELGISEYRQVCFKPYRLIYTVRGKDVYVLLIADSRRDLESLLQRRLLNTE